MFIHASFNAQHWTHVVSFPPLDISQERTVGFGSSLWAVGVARAGAGLKARYAHPKLSLPATGPVQSSVRVRVTQ